MQIQSKHIFTSTTALLKQGIPQQGDFLLLATHITYGALSIMCFVMVHGSWFAITDSGVKLVLIALMSHCSAEETIMATLAEEFADVLVNSQPSSPAGRAPRDFTGFADVLVSSQPSSPTRRAPEAVDSPTSLATMDLSAFFSPPGDDSSSSDEE